MHQQRNKSELLQRVTQWQSRIHLQVTGKYEQVNAMSLPSAGIASYEASQWIILRAMRWVAEQDRYIFSRLNECEAINYISHLFVHLNVHQLCNFKAAVSWSYKLCYSWVSAMFDCAAVCRGNWVGGRAAEEVGYIVIQPSLYVSVVITLKK